MNGKNFHAADFAWQPTSDLNIKEENNFKKLTLKYFARRKIEFC